MNFLRIAILVGVCLSTGSNAFADIFGRINDCERSMGANGCIYDLLRELAADGVYSGGSSSGPTIYRDREFFGHDITEVTAFPSNLEQCIASCQQYGSQCAGVVLTNIGYCHLKNVIIENQLTIAAGYTTVLVRP